MKVLSILKKCFLSSLMFFVFAGYALSTDPLTSKLNEIEKNYYGYTYTDSVPLRLSRLEKTIYGNASNKPQRDRIEKIYKDLNMGASTAPNSSMQNSTPQTTAAKDIGPKAEAGIKYPIVDKLEQKTFKKTYLNEDIYIRLSRLEKQVFKKESTASLNERVDALRDKLLGGNKFAENDVDTSNDEIVLENGYRYNGYEDQGQDFGKMSGAAADADDSHYNYYSYENSKNQIPEVQSTTVDSRNPDGTVGNYAGQDYDLGILEKSLFGKNYTNEASSKRLARLESQVFQRTFSDGEEARTQRLLAVTTAKKTSQEYDSNKWARRLNTGIQIGSILLMIVAMIL